MAETGLDVLQFGGVAAVEDDVEVVESEFLGEAESDAVAGSGDESPGFVAVVVSVQG